MFVDDEEIGIKAVKRLNYPVGILIWAQEIITGGTEEAKVDIEAFACTCYFLCRSSCRLFSKPGSLFVVQKTEWMVIKLVGGALYTARDSVQLSFAEEAKTRRPEKGKVPAIARSVK